MVDMLLCVAVQLVFWVGALAFDFSGGLIEGNAIT